MKREVELKRRLQTLHSLGEAIGAMKSLSAHHFRETRKTVEPARSYRDGVERILGLAGASIERGDGPAGLLIIGAELGLCGGYNRHVVEAGTSRRAELGDGPSFCVGHRAAALLGRRGVELESIYEGPTSAHGITGLLLKLAEDVLTAYATERLSSFHIVSSRFAGVGVASPQSVRLLPVESAPGQASREARYVGREHFVSVVVREYLYITLYELLLDALASEHGARLAATQSAERWLDKRTERIRRRLMASRRESSTQEMIEISAGARARNASVRR